MNINYGVHKQGLGGWMLGRTVEDINAIWEEAEKSGVSPEEICLLDKWKNKKIDLDKNE